MDCEQVLQECARLIGRELSALEAAIARGAWENESYEAIARSVHADPGHAKNVGSALWRLLSERLHQKVSKKSFRAAFEALPVSPQAPEVRSPPPFRVQVRAWFETLGYAIAEYQETGDRWFAWLLRIPQRRGFDRVLVRVVESGEASLGDLMAAWQAKEGLHADEAWLVAVRRVSSAARVESEKSEYGRRLFCYTFDELIDEAADFTPYIEWLTKEVQRREIERYYVPLASTKAEIDLQTRQSLGTARYGEKDGWTDGYIDRWLDDPAKEHISILGEFGTGKTWFVLHYAWVALQKYLQAKERGLERPRLPLVIQLRDYAKALNVENVLAGFFFSQHNIRLTGEMFDRLNRMGKLLLIFDGFDEMADRVDRQKMINNFWELAQVVVPGAKAILTCRTEHFPEAREGRSHGYVFPICAGGERSNPCSSVKRSHFVER